MKLRALPQSRVHFFAAFVLLCCCTSERIAPLPEKPQKAAIHSGHHVPRMPPPRQEHALQPQDLLIPDSCTLAESVHLDRAQVTQDIQLLLYAMNEAYGGRKYVSQAAFVAAMKQLRELPLKLPQNSSLVSSFNSSSLGMLESIDEILYAIPDNHLQPRSPRSGLSQYRLARQRKGSVGGNIWQQADSCWGVTEKSVSVPGGEKKIAVLSLTSFPAPEDQRWTGFKNQIEKIIKEESIFIIDLRGNAGGSDVMAAWLASRLLGRTVVSPFEVVVRSTTPESLALSANNWKLKIIWNRLEKKPNPPYFEARLLEKMRVFEQSMGHSKEAPNGEERIQMAYQTGLSDQPRYPGRVILLTDALCASSCESLVEFFQELPNAITVGENTAGSVHFADVGILLLPNSQLMVQIPTDFWRYKDGRYLERVGYPPKINVAKGKNAMDTALRLAGQFF